MIACLCYVFSLEKQSYEHQLQSMFAKATYLDAKKTNPCLPESWKDLENTGKTYVLFFHLPMKTHFQINKDYRLLLEVKVEDFYLRCNRSRLR